MTPEDLDPPGVVSEEAIERWLEDARLAYIARCRALVKAAGAPTVELRFRSERRLNAALLGRPAHVTVSASATEVRDSSFTLAVRIRAVGEQDAGLAGSATVVWLEDVSTGKPRSLGKDVRDELLELERAAKHFN